MQTTQAINVSISDEFRDFFKSHHDKLLCTASEHGEPSIAIIGTPRLTESNVIELELSDDPSITLNNILVNTSVVILIYEPAQRARDYKGVRIYAEVVEILTQGEKLDQIRATLRERFGDEKADAVVANVTCRIKQLRPIVDRGQAWNELPFPDDAN